MILDKTGTLTFGKPKLTEQVSVDAARDDEVLQLVASVERYSKHPLAVAILDAAQSRGLELKECCDDQ